MKTDSNKEASGQWSVVSGKRPEADVERLLATVEHAGRDERRQQELGEMIDRMAGESGQWPVVSGQKGHGAWWWVSRVAAAACVLFFIGTAVRVWFIPTESGSPMVAEAVVPEMAPVAFDSTPAATTVVAVGDRSGANVPKIPAPRRASVRPQTMATEADSEESSLAEEYLAEEIEQIEPAEVAYDTVPAVIIEDDFAPDIEVAAAVEEPTQPVEPVTVASKPAKPTRHSIFRTLFRPAEPSLMEGTTLALLQF